MPAPERARLTKQELNEHHHTQKSAVAGHAADRAWATYRAEVGEAVAGLVTEIDCLLDYMDKDFVSEVVTRAIAVRIRVQRTAWDKFLEGD